MLSTSLLTEEHLESGVVMPTMKDTVEARIARFRTGVLPLIAADPERAFPTSIAKRFPKTPTDTMASLQNNIGAALRQLQEEGMLTAAQEVDPESKRMVRKYSLTEKGQELLRTQKTKVRKRTAKAA